LELIVEKLLVEGIENVKYYYKVIL